jgi:hypothetical protein
MTKKAEIYFALYGNGFDPDEVTRWIGFTPSSISREASPKPKYSRWVVSSGRIENDIIDVYEMSSALLARLAPYAQKIASVKKELKLEAILEVVLWITTDETKSTPAIGFEPELIAFLNTVGATIDIDTYLNR